MVDQLTFGELISLSVDSAPAEYYHRLLKYERLVMLTKEASTPILKFSDFNRTYDTLKAKLYAQLSMSEITMLEEYELQIKSWILGVFAQHFS